MEDFPPIFGPFEGLFAGLSDLFGPILRVARAYWGLLKHYLILAKRKPFLVK